MGFVKITKNTKTEMIEASAPEKKTSNNMLDVLNNAAEGFSYDFGRDSASREDGRLKTERGLVGAIITTIISISLAIGIVVGIYILVTEITGFEVDFFDSKSYYSDEAFNTEMRSCLILLSALLFGSCILLVLFINTTIRGLFKKRYLKKMNVYLYDILVVFINIVCFVMVGVLFFRIINGLNTEFATWIEANVISKNANVGVMNWFKYAVVVIVSLFLSINSISGIGIVHKKNKFVFEEAL